MNPTIPTKPLAFGFRDHLYRLAWRFAQKARRYRMAWRYATGRLTTDDAQVMTMDLRHLAGWYPLADLDAARVQEEMLELFEDHPKLRGAVDAACDRVFFKWDSDGEETGHARDWAIKLAIHYLHQDGIRLTPLDEDGEARMEEALEEMA